MIPTRGGTPLSGGTAGTVPWRFAAKFWNASQPESISVNVDLMAERFYDRMGALDAPGTLELLADDFVGHVAKGLPGGLGGSYTGPGRMFANAWTPHINDSDRYLIPKSST